MLPGQFPLHDGANRVDHIITGEIIGGRNLGLPGGFFKSLPIHDLSALQTELHPGIGVDAVINTVMARLVAAGHATICRIDDSPTIQRSNVSTPEIDSILKRGQFRQPGNLLCCQFSLQIGILHFKKSLADGSRMTNIHQ